MVLFSKTSLAVGSSDDVTGCDLTPKWVQGDKLRQDKKKESWGLWVLG